MIYKMTGGVPRSINLLCDTALLICMSENGDKVTGRLLKEAHDTLDSDVIMVPKERRSGRFFGMRKIEAGVFRRGAGSSSCAGLTWL